MNESKGKDDYWRYTSLGDMSREQWEWLCDGCGRCCLNKLEDIDSGELLFTSVACAELDLNNARCRHYPTRKERVPDCLVLFPDMDEQIYQWLPDTCAYRRLWQGEDLPLWHPLVTGSRQAMRLSGVSVITLAISERLIKADDLEDYVIDLPVPGDPA